MTTPKGSGPNTPSAPTLLIGTLAIRVRAQPMQTLIGEIDLDAIVSSNDSTLSTGGGVSVAIEGIAGSSIRAEIAADLPLPVGTVAVTSGGKLPVKYILHAITLDANDLVVPTARTIRQLYREILSRCETLQIEHIAIPALATGAAGVDPRTSAEQLAHAIRAHALNPTILRSIVLPIPNPLVFKAFAAAIAAPRADDITGGIAIAAPGTDDLLAGTHDLLYGAADSVSISVRPTAPRSARSWFQWRRDKPSPTPGATEPPPVRSAVPPIEAALRLDNQTSRPLLGSRYVLLEEIGRGGMAVVHLAWDLVLRRTVAIKILRPDCVDPQSLKREAATAFELTHNGIIRLYHFEPAGETRAAYLVMEYLSWPSGEKWIADAGEVGLPVRAVQEVGIRVCDALAYAHSRNVLHLDIKPSNIFVDPAAESAKLGDFGLAQISSSGGAALQVRPAGTPAYMAPEQITLGAKVTAATDVYQMAATLWDFLTGSPPKPMSIASAMITSDRQPLLAVLRQALVPEPRLRPTAAKLGASITGAAIT